MVNVCRCSLCERVVSCGDCLFADVPAHVHGARCCRGGIRERDCVSVCGCHHMLLCVDACLRCSIFFVARQALRGRHHRSV